MEKQKEEYIKEILYSKKKLEEFNKVPQILKGEVLHNLPKKSVKTILTDLEDTEIIKILKFLDFDESANILRVLDLKRAKKIISSLEKDNKEKIELLLRFDKETAAGLMTLNYIQVDYDSKISDVIKDAETHERKTGKFPIILVVKKGSFLGELPVRALINSKKQDKVSKHIKKIPSVLYNKNFREIPKILKTNSHDKIVVIDDEKSILGLIYAHDLLELIDESRDLGDFAGVKKEEDVLDSARFKIKNRYRWLIVNLATAFLAASVVGLFDETISKFVILAVYMPIVAGMGGNAATQTLAVFVRGLALKEISWDKKAIKPILNEVMAGATNGLITGLIAAAVAVLWNQSAMLGVVIGLAMIINLIIAGFFGGTIPLVMKKLGKDPASSATIFITTATDVFGFFAFLGLATLLL
jgi:magnesium transporter